MCLYQLRISIVYLVNDLNVNYNGMGYELTQF